MVKVRKSKIVYWVYENNQNKDFVLIWQKEKLRHFFEMKKDL